MGKNSRNISKNVSSKYIQKLLDYAKQSTTDASESVSKKSIQKTAKPTGDLTGNKIDNKVTWVSKYLQQNNSETVTNKHDKEITKWIPKEKQLQVSMIKKYLTKYLKKDISLQKKDRKLLMIWD